MKYVIEMGSSDMLYVPRLIKIDSGIQKLMGEHTHTGTDSKAIS
jgi:hypothetical protein